MKMEIYHVILGDRGVKGQTRMYSGCSPIQERLGQSAEANKGSAHTIWGLGEGKPHLTSDATSERRGN